LNSRGFKGAEQINIQVDGNDDIGGRFAAPHTAIFFLPYLILSGMDMSEVRSRYEAYRSNVEDLVNQMQFVNMLYGSNDYDYFVQSMEDSAKRDAMKKYRNLLFQESLSGVKSRYEAYQSDIDSLMPQVELVRNLILYADAQRFAIVVEDEQMRSALFQESFGSKLDGFYPKTIVVSSVEDIPEGFGFAPIHLDLSQEESKDPISKMMLATYGLEVLVAEIAEAKGINFVTQDEVNKYKEKTSNLEDGDLVEVESVNLQQLIRNIEGALARNSKEFIDVVIYGDVDKSAREELRGQLSIAFPNQFVQVFTGTDWNHHSYGPAPNDPNTLFVLLGKEDYAIPTGENISKQSKQINTNVNLFKKIRQATQSTLGNKSLSLNYAGFQNASSENQLWYSAALGTLLLPFIVLVAFFGVDMPIWAQMLEGGGAVFLLFSLHLTTKYNGVVAQTRLVPQLDGTLRTETTFFDSYYELSWVQQLFVQWEEYGHSQSMIRFHRLAEKGGTLNTVLSWFDEFMMKSFSILVGIPTVIFIMMFGSLLVKLNQRGKIPTVISRLPGFENASLYIVSVVNRRERTFNAVSMAAAAAIVMAVFPTDAIFLFVSELLNIADKPIIVASPMSIVLTFFIGLSVLQTKNFIWSFVTGKAITSPSLSPVASSYESNVTLFGEDRAGVRSDQESSPIYQFVLWVVSPFVGLYQAVASRKTTTQDGKLIAISSSEQETTNVAASSFVNDQVATSEGALRSDRLQEELESTSVQGRSGTSFFGFFNFDTFSMAGVRNFLLGLYTGRSRILTLSTKLVSFTVIILLGVSTLALGGDTTAVTQSESAVSVLTMAFTVLSGVVLAIAGVFVVSKISQSFAVAPTGVLSSQSISPVVTAGTSEGSEGLFASLNAKMESSIPSISHFVINHIKPLSAPFVYFISGVFRVEWSDQEVTDQTKFSSRFARAIELKMLKLDLEPIVVDVSITSENENSRMLRLLPGSLMVMPGVPSGFGSFSIATGEGSITVFLPASTASALNSASPARLLALASILEDVNSAGVVIRFGFLGVLSLGLPFWRVEVIRVLTHIWNAFYVRIVLPTVEKASTVVEDLKFQWRYFISQDRTVEFVLQKSVGIETNPVLVVTAPELVTLLPYVLRMLNEDPHALKSLIVVGNKELDLTELTLKAALEKAGIHSEDLQQDFTVVNVGLQDGKLSMRDFLLKVEEGQELEEFRERSKRFIGSSQAWDFSRLKELGLRVKDILFIAIESSAEQVTALLKRLGNPSYTDFVRDLEENIADSEQQFRAAKLIELQL